MEIVRQITGKKSDSLRGDLITNLAANKPDEVVATVRLSWKGKLSVMTVKASIGDIDGLTHRISESAFRQLNPYLFGVYKYGEGDLASAAVVARTIVSDNAGDSVQLARANNLLGVVLSSQNKVDDAITAYRMAVQLDPDNVIALSNLGYILNQKGKVDESTEMFKKCQMSNTRCSVRRGL